ncbi:Flp pilus assembly protein TadB [Friedmanniella endophytica]|uniref:Flp pilus assembly protein TadB n=1 Tax=Microlunatus kandeliicorticis TaxID=1759536 RepID=A0A7W3IRN7_9ACTN|nr:type II secretion system F family protein [Microlunatus kandeliicorticis]MBA8794002.1 Flp pilus assembly protein TadB [Microlunatus kandeliicorticis]
MGIGLFDAGPARLFGVVRAVGVIGLVDPDQGALLVAACGLALATVLLGMASPAGRLRRLARLDRPDDQDGPTDVGPVRSASRRVAGLLAARPEASPLRARVAIAAVTGVGVLAVSTVAQAFAAPGRLVAALLAAAVCLVLAGKLEPGAARERRLRAVIDLPHLLDLLAAGLGAGLPLRVAVGQVGPLVGGPLGEALDQVLRQIELGVPEARAWRALRDHPALGRLSLDLARSVDSGLRLSATLAHHASDARGSRRAALEARARSVGVHSVPPLMVCFLPAFLLIGVVPTGVSAFLHALG